MAFCYFGDNTPFGLFICFLSHFWEVFCLNSKLMPTNQKVEYAGGLLPKSFIDLIQIAAILGFLSALALVSALVYKGIEKLVGPEEAKKYRLIIVIVDVVVLLVFIFMYLVVI